jgi:hypothetical protein
MATLAERLQPDQTVWIEHRNRKESVSFYKTGENLVSNRRSKKKRNLLSFYA